MPRQGTKIDPAVAQVLRWLLVALRMLPKLALAGLGALVVGLVLAFIVWDVRNFQSQRPQLDKLIAAATEEERHPPEAIVRLVRAAYGERGIAAEAIMVLMRDPTNPLGLPKRMRMGDWHIHGLLSWICVRLHLSEQEQITLVVSRSYMGRDMRGFSAASQAIFSRPLALLSLEEAATLVAIPPCPNCFRTQSEWFKWRRDHLLSTVQAPP